MRMKILGQLVCLTLVLSCFNVSLAERLDLRIVTWNVQSHEASLQDIKSQMANLDQLHRVDIWVFQEVRPNWADEILVRANQLNSATFSMIQGSTGPGNQKLIVVFNENALYVDTATEDSIIENLSTEQYNSQLLIRFLEKRANERFWLFACDLVEGTAYNQKRLRYKQAKGLSRLAADQNYPVIVAGDLNLNFFVPKKILDAINFNLEGSSRKPELIWLVPTGSNNWKNRHNSLKVGSRGHCSLNQSIANYVDDGFYVSRSMPWKTASKVVESSLCSEATKSDHRPVIGWFKR